MNQSVPSRQVTLGETKEKYVKGDERKNVKVYFKNYFCVKPVVK